MKPEAEPQSTCPACGHDATPDNLRRIEAEVNERSAADYARQRLRGVIEECNRALAELDGGHRADTGGGETVRRLVDAWEYLRDWRAARETLRRFGR